MGSYALMLVSNDLAGGLFSDPDLGNNLTHTMQQAACAPNGYADGPTGLRVVEYVSGDEAALVLITGGAAWSIQREHTVLPDAARMNKFVRDELIEGVERLLNHLRHGQRPILSEDQTKQLGATLGLPSTASEEAVAREFSRVYWQEHGKGMPEGNPMDNAIEVLASDLERIKNHYANDYSGITPSILL